MKFFKTVVALSIVCFAPVSAQEETDAMRDLQMGLQGIQEASKDPALLAQLMQDLQVSVEEHAFWVLRLCQLIHWSWSLQNPEMMAEAKKMMDSPEFKKQMKKMSESKEFKNGAQKTGKLWIW